MFHSLQFHFRSQSFAGFTKVPKCCCYNVCFCGHCKQFKERQWILFPRMLCCSGGSALSFSLWCLIADANAYSYSCFQLDPCFVRFCFSFGFSFILVCYLSFFSLVSCLNFIKTPAYMHSFHAVPLHRRNLDAPRKVCVSARCLLLLSEISPAFGLLNSLPSAFCFCIRNSDQRGHEH